MSDESASNPPAVRELNAAEKVFGSVWFWGAIIASVFAFNIIRSVTAEIPQPPKPMITLPQFELTDQRAEPFGAKQLAGRIWIANFIFTSCPTMCPRLTETMQKVKHRLRGMGDAVHLVSFSVDPERDTPEVLANYAMKYGATPAKWSFLTGDLTKVEEAVVGGFKLPMEKDQVEPGEIFDITHGSRFVLVDPDNRIRGYYETDEAGINRLIKDVGLLGAHEQHKAQQALKNALSKKQ